MEEIIGTIEELINQGRYLEARIKSSDALKENDNLRLNQLYALALSKSGTPEAGRDQLAPFLTSHPENSETAGILGSIYKELFKKNQQTSFALQSRDTYFDNFTKTKNYYTGINAASMSAILMQNSKTKTIATEVISLIDPATTDFWELATLGEAWLLCKNKDKSLAYYIKARKSAGTDWGKITSVYHQLWLLNHYVAVAKDVLKMFQPPNIVAFTGHMVDAWDRPTPRFPEALVPEIKQSIKNTIRTQNAQIGYSSLACGGDILFAEAMEEAGGEVNVFLPFAEKDFIETSIGFAGPQWVERFKRIVKKYPPTYITKEAYNGNDDFFQYLSTIVFGLAVLRGTLQHTEPSLITVLSSIDLKRKRGGTRDAMRLWPYPNKIVNINPDDFSVPADVTPTQQSQTPPKIFTKDPDQPILFMLYTELDQVSPVIFNKIVEALNTSIQNTGLTPITYINEDEKILLGFDSYTYLLECLPSIFKVAQAARVSDQIKISIHCGSVQLTPAEGQKEPLGSEVDFLKTIYTLTPSGACCASDYFSSVLALEPKKYELRYMGMVPDEHQSTRTIYRVSDMLKKYY